jgi:hypothetical protein
MTASDHSRIWLLNSKSKRLKASKAADTRKISFFTSALFYIAVKSDKTKTKKELYLNVELHRVQVNVHHSVDLNPAYRDNKAAVNQLGDH